MKCPKIIQLKQQVYDMVLFYNGEINHHVLNARINFVLGVHDYLRIPSWVTACSKKITFHKQNTIKRTKPTISIPKEKKVFSKLVSQEDEEKIETTKAKFNPVFDASPIKVDSENPFEAPGSGWLQERRKTEWTSHKEFLKWNTKVYDPKKAIEESKQRMMEKHKWESQL